MLDDCLSQALTIMEEIRRRLAEGDSASELMDRLTKLVLRIVDLVAASRGALSETTQSGVRQLFESLQSASAEGTTWITQVALPRLQALANAEHGIKTYRLRDIRS